ncbi:MAG TPA: LysE family translocator [Roseiarcus sp.]|jgi:threonine/homoserine/homoserine lactone efflux protein|nr:LysE family translocator [Roseiarcus sp.]
MSYTENLWLFFLLLLGIIIVPGMDMMFVLANALTGGRRAGLSATAGVMIGGAVHTLFGALGVGMLLKLAPSLFATMLLAGAAYMAWIGATLARSSIRVDAPGAMASRSPWTAFRQGTATCLLNPKAYLFVVSVYPQFMQPQYGALWLQAMTMGVMTLLTQFGVYGGLAFAAGRSSDLLVSNPRATLLVGRAAGVLLIAIAAMTAWRGWSVSS